MMCIVGFLLTYVVIGFIVAYGSMFVDARRRTAHADEYLPVVFLWPFWLLILCFVVPLELLAELANEHGRNSRS